MRGVRASGTCSCTSAPAMTLTRSFRPKPRQSNYCAGPRQVSPFPRPPESFRHSNSRVATGVGLLQPPSHLQSSKDALRKSMYENMSVCLHVCMYVCICTYIHTYIHDIHTYILTYLHTYILTYLHTYILAYLRTYILTSVHTYIHT